MSLKIHITLILVLVYNYFFSDIKLFIMFYMFAIMHELSHAVVALLLRIDIKEFEFTPFGVCVKYENNLSDLKELIISVSGPVFSMILACLYGNKIYFIINILITIFNLLPVYPLDGGRVLRVILKFIFGYKKGKIISTYLTNLILILFLFVSIFIAAYYKNFFFLAMCFYMLKLSKSEIKKDEILRAINYLQNDE